jgi:hypothetical protein
MNRILFFILFLFTVTRPTLAQYGTCNAAKLKELPNRKLIVVTELDSPRLIELLGKKRKTKEIDLYKASVENYNTNLRAIVERYWPFGQDIEYMSFSEADRMRRAKVKEYAVLYCGHVENFTTKGDEGARRHSGLVWEENFPTVNTKRDHWDTYAVMEIKLIEDLGKHETVFSQNLANILPDKADLLFGMQMLNQYVQADAAKAKFTQLQDVLSYKATMSDTTTLLLRKDWLHPYINENNVRAIYPHPYRIVDAHEYEAKVDCADSAFAYVQIIPEVDSRRAKIKVSYLHLVLNAADGAVLAVYSPGGQENEGKIITKSALKEYVRQDRSGNKR